MTPAAQQAQEAQAVQLPYVALAGCARPACGDRLPLEAAQDRYVRNVGSTDGGGAGVLPDRGSAWKYRHLVLGAVAIFVYVGAEVAIGSLLVNYFKEPYTLGLPEAKGPS